MTIFDRDFGRVWYDGTLPCVFSTLIGLPDVETMNELLDRELALICEVKKRNGFVLSVCDMQYISPIAPDTASTYLDRLGGQFSAGLIHKSFVKPPYKFVEKLNSYKTIKNRTVSTSTHLTLKDALADMNKRSIKNDYSTVSNVFTFLKYL